MNAVIDMNTPLMQFNPQLLVLVLAASLVGTLPYLLLRLIEVRVPLFIAIFGMVSTFFLVDFSFKVDEQGWSHIQSASLGNLFFLMWLVMCAYLGAKFHKPIQTAYGSISDALLMAGAMASAIGIVLSNWANVPETLSHERYSVGSQFVIAAFYIALGFCSVAPVATAFLLSVLKNSYYSPGIDRQLKQGESL